MNTLPASTMPRSAGPGKPSQWRPILAAQFTPVNIVAWPVALCGRPSTPRQASMGLECRSRRRQIVGHTSGLTGLSDAGSLRPMPSTNRNIIFTCVDYTKFTPPQTTPSRSCGVVLASAV